MSSSGRRRSLPTPSGSRLKDSYHHHVISYNDSSAYRGKVNFDHNLEHIAYNIIHGYYTDSVEESFYVNSRLIAGLPRCGMIHVQMVRYAGDDDLVHFFMQNGSCMADIAIKKDDRGVPFVYIELVMKKSAVEQAIITAHKTFKYKRASDLYDNYIFAIEYLYRSLPLATKGTQKMKIIPHTLFYDGAWQAHVRTMDINKKGTGRGTGAHLTKHFQRTKMKSTFSNVASQQILMDPGLSKDKCANGFLKCCIGFLKIFFGPSKLPDVHLEAWGEKQAKRKAGPDPLSAYYQTIGFSEIKEPKPLPPIPQTRTLRARGRPPLSPSPTMMPPLPKRPRR